MVMIRCSDCSWLFHHRLVAVTIHVVLTGSDRLEERGRSQREGEESQTTRQAGFDLQLQKCILYPKTLEITRDNKIETQIPQNR